MKPLDLTKPLQTRRGEKAELVYDGLTGDFPLVVIVHLACGRKKLRTYTREGVHYMEKNSPANLMNVPERGECWVNIYPEVSAFGYKTKKQADERGGPDRIACVRVEYVKGEGL